MAENEGGGKNKLFISVASGLLGAIIALCGTAFGLPRLRDDMEQGMSLQKAFVQLFVDRTYVNEEQSENEEEPANLQTLLVYHEETLNNGIYVGSYKGMWKDGKPQGKGEFVWSKNVDVEWLADKITKDSRYDGYWVNGEMEGRGVLKYPDGNVKYDGDWANGKWDGFGRHYSLKDGKYTGWYAECNWKEGKAKAPIIGYNNKGDMWFLKTANGRWEINLSEGKIQPAKESS